MYDIESAIRKLKKQKNISAPAFVDVAELLLRAIDEGDEAPDRGQWLSDKIGDIAKLEPEKTPSTWAVASLLWDLAEWTDDRDSMIGDEVEYRRVKGELMELLWQLRNEGWLPSLPYLRAYYEKKLGDRVVASLTLLVYKRDGALRLVAPRAEWSEIIEPLLSGADLELVEQRLPRELNGFTLREVNQSWGLASEFDQFENLNSTTSPSAIT